MKVKVTVRDPRNNKIAAIKFHRTLTNSGLKDAKDAIESHLPKEYVDARWSDENKHEISVPDFSYVVETILPFEKVKDACPIMMEVEQIGTEFSVMISRNGMASQVVMIGGGVDVKMSVPANEIKAVVEFLFERYIYG